MESIGTLAGGIAHDFNNILSSIIGFTELALDEAEQDSSIKESLQEVYSAGLRAKELVKQILAFARQSGEEIKPVKPRAIAEEITHLLRSSIPTTIKITQQFESDACIIGNPTQLHQVIMNLCTNAAHAMEDEGGQLTISIKDIDGDKIPADKQLKLPHGKYVQLQVADTGTGIPPDIIDSIFEPYFTTKGQGKGTGMGLAMVQGIVESYVGQIGVESIVGQGTTFTIYLPITRESKTSPDYQPEALPTGSERVLFVDDEPQIAKIARKMLEHLGYDVTSRVSSTEALELFKARSADFDVVITDMTMPDMTGDRLAIEIMKIRADIPVILCTGYSNRISEETAHNIGIKAFVYKPFVKADLARTVRKVLDEAKAKSCA
jgi:CheY-like chemotaxis protein